MSLIIIFAVLILIYFIVSWQTKRKIKFFAAEAEKNQQSVHKINELTSTILEILESDFNMVECSRCDDNTITLLEFNSIGTSVYVKCNTCGKRTWIKSKEDFDKGQEIIDKWEEIQNLGGYVGDEGIDISVGRINIDEEEINKNRREPIPQSVKDKVWNRDAGKCVLCRGDEKLEFDHIIPISKGGANTYRNLQLLCENCNRKKSNKIG